LPLACSYIRNRTHSPSNSRIDNTTWPRWLLRRHGSWFRRRRLLDDGDRRRPHKHSPAHITLKVPFPLDAAIILAALIFQLDAHPVPSCKMGLTYVSNSGRAAICELNGLADLKLLRHDAQLNGRASSYIPGGEKFEIRVDGRWEVSMSMYLSRSTL
jgi:hypothetical protein